MGTKIELGLTYKDSITGFEGVATGHCEYISGCNQTLLVPKVDEKGAHRDSYWFDDQRMVLIPDATKIVLDNGATPGSDKPAPIR
ncbi:hypothetical protein [Neoaquamicrobium sediminum]|uniref:hypothetical protein n=1 Tax=Neoaquamicrobium sediminum TaxID=1849104 RepID=UPI001564E663|nr:hypothetical protein [Mesorhizobium sediminum]NRC54193.1 hypothetical protein [Mesorhizobium sediminum]